MNIVAGKQTENLKQVVDHLAEARLRRRWHESTPYVLDEIQWTDARVLITELNFNGIEGIDFVRRLRKRNRPKFREIPVLALQEAEDITRDRVIELVEVGVSDVLLCPYDPTAFRKRCQAYHDHRRLALREPDKEALKELPDQPTQADLDAVFLDSDIMAEVVDPILRVKEIDDRRRRVREEEQKGGKPVLGYDFRHPMRISKDQMRTIENLHSNLARMMSSSFSMFARQIVDCDIAFVDQTTYAEFIMSLSNPSVSYTFTLEPLSGPAIIDFATPISYAFIERQLGGPGGRRPGDVRPLTAIERSIMAGIVTRSLADLEATWEPLMKVQVSDAELETNPEFMQVAAPSDTVILIAFEVNFAKASGLVNLCYPYFTIEPAKSLFNVSTWASRDTRRRRGTGHRQERLDQLRTIRTELQAFAGHGSLSAAELAALKEGDTILLDTGIDDPGVVFVENVPAFYARPGLGDSGNYAVEIEGAIPVDEARRYAK